MQVHIHNDTVMDFWRCVCLCHDVLIIKQEGKQIYSGASQDEINLLNAAKDSGLARYEGRDS